MPTLHHPAPIKLRQRRAHGFRRKVEHHRDGLKTTDSVRLSLRNATSCWSVGAKCKFTCSLMIRLRSIGLIGLAMVGLHYYSIFTSHPCSKQRFRPKLIIKMRYYDTTCLILSQTMVLPSLTSSDCVKMPFAPAMINALLQRNGLMPNENGMIYL